jgi:hypothetical protein
MSPSIIEGMYPSFRVRNFSGFDPKARNLPELVRRAADENEIVSVSRKASREFQPDPAACAGEECRLSWLLP